MTQPTGAKKVRMAWPDVARGVSILGVMTLHATLEVPGGLDTPIAKVNEFIATLRMPLFFIVAGFFSVKIFNFSLWELFRKRLWFLLVPYLFWAPVEMILDRNKAWLIQEIPLPEPMFYVDSVYYAQNMYWFLWSLMLFTIILWATKRLPWIVQLLIPAIVIAASPWLLLAGNLVMPRIIAYLPLFLLGAYLRPHIAKFADNALHPWVAITSTMLALVSFQLYALPFDGPWRPALNVIVSLVYLPFGVTVAILLSKVPMVGEGLKRIGRHTLVAYLGHPIALIVFFGFFFVNRDNGFNPEATSFIDTPLCWVIINMGFCAIGTIAMYGISKTKILGWTVHPPAIKLPKVTVPHWPHIPDILRRGMKTHGTAQGITQSAPASTTG